MRKIGKRDILRLVIVLSLVAGIGFAMGTVGRFVPTHKIVEPVYCGSCHPEQVGELASTTHIASFAAAAQKMANYPTNGPEGSRGYGTNVSDAEAISMGCTMCHNYWENFKWFGVVDADIVPDQYDCPDANGGPCSTYDPIYDIYGNAVSPYGLGSTKAFIAKMNSTANATVGIEPWQAGIDVWEYTDAEGTHRRLDWLWSALSAKSPGPVAFQVYNKSDYPNLTLARGSTRTVSCGTAEKGMCHIAENAVAMSAANKKLEYPDQRNLSGQTSSMKSSAGVFYTHEMAYTTAQYAAKPVKLCGACHVFKLPPMKWGGEPWAGFDIREESLGIPYGEKGFKQNTTAGLIGGGAEHEVRIGEPVRGAIVDSYGDPFNLQPTYDQSGSISWTRDFTTSSAANFNVTYKTPDWAHQIVPCIRCHSHAGINGESVSDNN